MKKFTFRMDEETAKAVEALKHHFDENTLSKAISLAVCNYLPLCNRIAENRKTIGRLEHRVSYYGGLLENFSRALSEIEQFADNQNENQ